MKVKAKTIDEFLATLSDDKQATLQKLRKTIKTIIPDAEECISYGIPAFRLNGKPLVWFGAGANHCAFYPAGEAIARFQDELKSYDTSKGTIRFPANKPLPAALVRKLVKARIEQVEVNKGKTRKPSSARAVQSPSSASSVRVSRPRRNPDRRSPQLGDTQTDPAVIAFMKALDHPLKKVVEAVRQIIISVSPAIHEGIKWNSPSFRTTEWFATFNLREDRVWLILHLGANVKDNSTKGLAIADPTGLLKWLAKDRCLVTFENDNEVAAKRKPLEGVLREWIRLV